MKCEKLFFPGLSLLWVLVLAAACQEQPVPGIPPVPSGGDANKVSFRASIERRSSETKTLQAGTSVRWSAGDQVRVFNADHPSGIVFTLQSGEGKSEGTFAGDAVSGEGPFFFVYPASLGGTLSGESVTGIEVPEIQNYAVNNYGAGASVAVGRASALTGNPLISFQNADGLLVLSVKGTKKISKIHVYALGAESLCGAASLSIPANGAPSLAFTAASRDGAGQRLTLDGGRRGIQLSQSGTTFCLTVPAGAFSQGLYLEVLDTEQHVMPQSYPSHKPLDRNAIRELAPLSYAPQYKAAFLLPELVKSPAAVEAGGFTGILAADSPFAACCPYIRGMGQYAFSFSDGTRNLRIQDWSRGFSLNLGIPAGEPLVPGTSTAKAVDITTQGNTGDITPGSATMQVLKKVGDRVWLVDGSKGYIMFLED